MERYDYYPSAIYREEIPDWVKDTLKYGKKYFDRSEKYLEENNIKSLVVQTEHMAKDSELSFLSSYFRDKGVSILKEQGYITDKYEFFVKGMWGQEFGCTASNILHTHSESQISGFYFLETPKGGSYPIFDDPRAGKKMSDLDSVSNEQITMATPYLHFNNVKAGTMLFFNSWLPHMISENKAEDKTKFIHFILACRDRFI